MIKNNLKQLLAERGRTITWLARSTGVGYQRLLKHVHNKADMIQYATLEKICRALSCDIDDVLIIVDEPMRVGVSKQRLDKQRPRVPDWIRRFPYPGWTNVFQLVPNNDHLYGTETLFSDWNARVLLLAKDGCPTWVIRERCDKAEPRPWRHGVNGEIGAQTNKRLCRLVSLIPEKKLPTCYTTIVEQAARSERVFTAVHYTNFLRAFFLGFCNRCRGSSG